MLNIKIFVFIIGFLSVYSENNYFNKIFDKLDDPNLLKYIIKERYDGRIKNVKNIINDMEKLPTLELISFGYKTLYDEMKENKDLYSSELVAISNRIEVALENPQQSLNSKNNLLYIKNNLPQSVKHFPWNSNFQIQNERYMNYLQVGSNNSAFDVNRRRVFSADCSDDNNCLWNIEPVSNQTIFYLKNIQFNEYLYVESNQFQYDKRRRNLFTSRNNTNKFLKEGEWEFEPIENSEYFRIKNSFWDEYFYAFYINNEANRPVFSWKTGGCDGTECNWKFVGEIELLERFSSENI